MAIGNLAMFGPHSTDQQIEDMIRRAENRFDLMPDGGTRVRRD
jgi:hypothetical protein